MPNDNLDTLTGDYGTFGKSRAQKEPVRTAAATTPRTAKPPVKERTVAEGLAEAKYRFDHASDWLNKKNQNQAQPKAIIKPAPGKKPAANKKVAAAVTVGAPDDGSV